MKLDTRLIRGLFEGDALEPRKGWEGERKLIRMAKDEEDWSKCSLFGFERMMSSDERHNHMQKDRYHLGKVMEWASKGPDGRPRLEPFREQNLVDSGVNPICWASGMIMKTR